MGRVPALLAAIALAGCGGGSHQPAPIPVSTLVAAGRATQAAGSFTFTIGGTIDVAGQSFPIEGNGAVDARARRGRASLDLTRAVAQSGLGLPPPEARADAVVIGTVLYVRSPYLARRRGTTRTWLRFASTELRPLAYLSAAQAVERLGTETVDGVKTTRYSTEIDLRTYAQHARPAEAPALNTLMRQVGDSLPVDLWIDSSNRIRRIQAQVSTASFQALPQVDIGGFGTPVRVSPPPR